VIAPGAGPSARSLTSPTPDPVLTLREISVTFAGPRTGLWRRGEPVPALRNCDLDVRAGQTLSLVGESGSGKTTVTRVALGLQAADHGRMVIAGRGVEPTGRDFPAALRRQVQVVFQDPYASLNPSFTVRRLVAEGLERHGVVASADVSKRVDELLTSVGLDPSFGPRYPRELSGGQRQRVCIARALAPEPSLLILDEPISSLDVSTQAQILDLLADLQERLGLAYLFVSHDIGLVKRISHDVVVLYRGTVMESGPAHRVWDSPRHPYTRLLDASVPSVALDRSARAAQAERRMQLEVHAADGPVPTTGCVFVDRCPISMPVCRSTLPPTVLMDDGVRVSCHAVVPASEPS
jgi:oligopeptide/dipeptide ABC transporter ATP-binding protein